MCFCTIITQTLIWVKENISKLESWLFVETLVRTFLFHPSGLVWWERWSKVAKQVLSFHIRLYWPPTRLLRLPFGFWNIKKLQLNWKIVCSVRNRLPIQRKTIGGSACHYLLCGRVLIVLLNSRYVDKLFSSVVLTSLNRAKQISYFKHTPDEAGALYVALIYCGNNLLGCLVEWTLVCDWFLFRLRKYFHSEGQDTISSKHPSMRGILHSYHNL